MHVKMRTQYASARGAVAPGGILEVPDEEGRALVEGRFAEEVETAIKPAAEAATDESPEAAATGPSETATGKRSWRRGR